MPPKISPQAVTKNTQQTPGDTKPQELGFFLITNWLLKPEGVLQLNNELKAHGRVSFIPCQFTFPKPLHYLRVVLC